MDRKLLLIGLAIGGGGLFTLARGRGSSTSTGTETEPPRSKVDLSDLHESMREKVDEMLADLESKGWDPRVFEVKRSVARGDWLKENGQSKLGRDSLHVPRDSSGNPTDNGGDVWALDVISTSDGWDNDDFFDALQESAESVGLETGNDWSWRDAAHVQAPASMRAQYGSA